MQHPIHRTAGALQCNFERLQRAFALLDDAAQLQTAVSASRNLSGDQQTAKSGDVGGDGVLVWIGVNVMSWFAMGISCLKGVRGCRVSGGQFTTPRRTAVQDRVVKVGGVAATLANEA